MVGQEKLLNKISTLTLNTFPHTLLLEGLKGSGRHLLVTEICNKLKLDLIDLKSLGINEEAISFLNLSPIPKICLLDLSTTSIKEQNVLLKFLEEPLPYCYIILLCEDSAQVISTILNRCQIWKLQPYTKKQLADFYEEFTQYEEFTYSNDKIFDIADTPGDVVKLTLNTDINSIVDLVDNILYNIGNANFSNVLVLVNKIRDFDSEKGVVDFDVFLKIFIYVLKKHITEKSNTLDLLKLYEVYNMISNLYKQSKQSYLHFNNKYLYETFLLDLKFLMK